MKEPLYLHTTYLHHVSLQILAVLTIVLFFNLENFVHAMDVTLQWDANTEPNLAGYRIYYDTDSCHPYEGHGAFEGNSPIEIDFRDDDENPIADVVEFTLYGLPNGTWYFVVTAFNHEIPSLESGYSNEVSTSASVDTSPPHTMNHSPVPGATGVPIDTLISLEIRDPGVGVDLSSITMWVNGSEVNPSISGGPESYTLSYDPEVDFSFDESVSVEIDTSDLNGNTMVTEFYTFTITEPPESPEPPSKRTASTDSGGGGGCFISTLILR